MNESISNQEIMTLKCPAKRHWISFRLVDEFAESAAYAGLKYTLSDSQDQEYTGALDDQGYALIEDIYCGPAILVISSAPTQYPDPWYERLELRDAYPLPLTALQIAAEQSPIGPRQGGRREKSTTYLAKQRAAEEGARFFRIEVSDLVEATKHLPDPDASWGPRPSSGLKLAAGATPDQPGIALEPNQHHVLEIKALRAYSPIFSLAPEFSAINAYHLAVMSTFSYAPFSKQLSKGESYAPAPPPYSQPGSIGNVLREQLARQIKPTLFDKANYHLICEEVPYSKRLEVVPYDPARYSEQNGKLTPENIHFLHDKDTDAQAFITHSDRVILITIRGTAGRRDAARDIDARQVSINDGAGYAHRGFYKAFIALREFVEPYLENFWVNQTIIVCGHSLGGAIALLLADFIKRRPGAPQVLLYTYGAPRAGDRTFVEASKDLVHHRIVNHNDVVPSLPTTWMDAEWKMALPATAMLLATLAPPVQSISLLLAGILNLRGDPFQHHGEQHHFMPRKIGAGSEASVLWQPGCAAIDQDSCARFTANLSLQGDMPRRRSFIAQAFAFKEHFSDSGYARAALTNLLRWNASLSRDGQLFTEEEKADLQPQLTRLASELAKWEPGSFNDFLRQKRLRVDVGFEKMTLAQQRSYYDQGVADAKLLQAGQREALSRAQQRLTAQSSVRITAADVFGDQAGREDLQILISEWREQQQNREAELLVKNTSPSIASPAYG